MNEHTRGPVRIQNILQGLFLILIACLLASNVAGAAQAQSSGLLEISVLKTEEFPLIRFFLKAVNGEGKYLTDLQASQLQILEDGYTRPIQTLERIQPGMQIILSVNESPNLTNQFQNVSYYRILMQALENWAHSLPQGAPDNYSYVTNNGTQIVQASDPAQFTRSLLNYEPNLLAARPGITSLSMALDLTTDALPNPYMQRAILYVTPPPDATARQALPSIAEMAAQLGTRVFVWVIAPGYPLESAEIAPLRQLADLSGGELFLFNGSEDFPNPEHYFEAYRYIYQVGYQSAITTSGEHRLVVNLTHPGLQISSAELIFPLTVNPPNPIFMEPPAQIIRSFSETEEGTSALLTPDDVPIRILLEFPDGFTRDMKHTRLYVNEELVAENLAPPFEQFNLPLSNYFSSSTLRLRVEAEDELGLSQSSIETLVELIVEEPKKTWVEAVFSGRGLVILIALSVAALVLTLVILFTSQRNPFYRLKLLRERINRDPLTQPVAVMESRRASTYASVATPTVRKAAAPVNAPAKLIRLSEDGNPLPQRMIPLIRRETTLGSDPQQALCVLDSGAVNPLHARIVQDNEGQFFVFDDGSTAGTWVNFNQVTGEGKKLEHSDVIHFASMAFRFELREPNCIRQPTVTPYKTDEL